MKPDGLESRAFGCNKFPADAGLSIDEVLADIAMGGAHGKPRVVAILGDDLPQYTVGQHKRASNIRRRRLIPDEHGCAPHALLKRLRVVVQLEALRVSFRHHRKNGEVEDIGVGPCAVVVEGGGGGV